MSKIPPRALIITGYGINCEEETAKCFNWSGAEAEIVHINELIEGKSASTNTAMSASISSAKKLSNYQIIAFPGGFSYADETGSGNALANKIRNNLQAELLKFIQDDKLIIGICNGMQIMANLGLIPATDKRYDQRQAALMRNLYVTLECRWIWLKNTSKKCIWTRDIDMIHLPVSHGEGNFYVEPEILEKMHADDQIVFKYVKPIYDQSTNTTDLSSPSGSEPANRKFPFNPNGAMEDIAGVCDPTGKIFAMMPHPERFNSWTNEDGWELKKEQLLRSGKNPSDFSPEGLPTNGPTGAGLQILRNGVNYFK